MCPSDAETRHPPPGPFSSPELFAACLVCGPRVCQVEAGTWVLAGLWLVVWCGRRGHGDLSGVGKRKGVMSRQGEVALIPHLPHRQPYLDLWLGGCVGFRAGALGSGHLGHSGWGGEERPGAPPEGPALASDLPPRCLLRLSVLLYRVPVPQPVPAWPPQFCSISASENTVFQWLLFLCGFCPWHWAVGLSVLSACLISSRNGVIKFPVAR